MQIRWMLFCNNVEGTWRGGVTMKALRSCKIESEVVLIPSPRPPLTATNRSDSLSGPFITITTTTIHSPIPRPVPVPIPIRTRA